MFGSLPAVTVHTSPTLLDRPTRAAKEQVGPGPVVAIATRPQAGASGRAMADGKRTIVPDLRELMKLARGAFCDLDLDLDVVLERAVGDEIDFEVILGPVAKRGRAVVSARTPTIEHDWTGTSG